MNENTDEKKNPKTSKKFRLISACLAFILWGGWAYYINARFGMATGIKSGVTQGTASFLITLFMIRMVTWFFHGVSNRYLQLVLPALFTVSFTGSCLILIHYAVGTPRIIYTVSPAISVAFTFCLYTAYKLRFANP